MYEIDPAFGGAWYSLGALILARLAGWISLISLAIGAGMLFADIRSLRRRPPVP